MVGEHVGQQAVAGQPVGQEHRALGHLLVWGRRQQFQPQLEPLDQPLQIGLVGQERIGDHRRFGWVRRHRANRPSDLHSLQGGVEGEDRVLATSIGPALGIAGEVDHADGEQLEVVGRSRTAGESEQGLDGHIFGRHHVGFGCGEQIDGRVVREVGPHTGTVHDGLDAQAGQFRRRADARSPQQQRRLDHPASHDNLAGGNELRLAVACRVHADGPVAAPPHRHRQALAAHFEVGPAAYLGGQIRIGRRHPLVTPAVAGQRARTG